MSKRYGFIAGGTVLALALTAGCTNSSGNGNNNTAGGGANNGQTITGLSPVADIQAALSKASADKTVTIHGTLVNAATEGNVNGTLDGQEQFGSTVEMSMSMSIAGQQISEVWLGDAMYMKIPAMTAELGGKPWAKVSLSSMGSLGSTLQQLADSAKNSDPAAQLQPLLASGDVKKVGTETVDGVQTTHYSGDVDPATAFDSSQAAKNLTPEQISQLKSMLRASGVTNEKIDVWVASDGLPVEETISMNTNAGTEKVDLHLSKWGEPVSIAAPPADQVTDITSMMSSIMATPSS